MTSAGTSIDVAYRGIASVVHSADTRASSARQLRCSGACGKSGEARSAKKAAVAATRARAVAEPKQAAEEREAAAAAPAAPAAAAAPGPSRSFLAAWPPCPLPPAAAAAAARGSLPLPKSKEALPPLRAPDPMPPAMPPALSPPTTRAAAVRRSRPTISCQTVPRSMTSLSRSLPRSSAAAASVSPPVASTA